MKVEQIAVSDIRVVDRSRTELGDIDKLADSIAKYGLIQPIVINQDKRLVAGGRRHAAVLLLKWDTVPCVYRETLTEDELKELELEENVRRRDMDWREQCCAVAQIHRLKLKQANFTDWGYEQTGALLGRARSQVWWAVQVSNLIRAGDKEVIACDNMFEVVRLLVRRKEDEALKELAKRSVPVAVLPQYDGTEDQDDAVAMKNEASLIVPISLFIIHEPTDRFSVLGSLPPGCVNHILTDPPYAIEMSMLSQEGTGMDVSTVEAEHDVEDNLQLVAEFLPHAFRVLPEHGYCVMWCDTVHFQRLCELGANAGFVAQRWPLVWCKTHVCQNQASSYNVTKKTELAVVLRKPGTVLMHQPNQNYWVGTFEPDERKQFRHPFVKPAALWQWVAKAVALPGQTILDPFAGEGSCPLALLDQGYKPIAIECKEMHYNRLLENVKSKYTKMLGNVTFT